MVKREAFEIAKEYISHLKLNNIDIAKAYLFGSYAKEQYNENSDLDLAIIIRDLKDKFSMQVKLLIIRRNKELIIEPHPFDVNEFVIPNPFVEEIIKTGIEIN